MAKILKLRVKSGLKRGWLLLPATCFVALFAAGIAVWPQTPAFNITLAGQSMIRSDFRVHTPAELATISPLLTGDVIFTNFEATVVEKGQSLHDGRFLSPPEALDALKALGFNLLALSDNHSFDLKVSGVQNTLREVKSRNIVHAGIGNNVEEAAAPGYLHTPKGTVALVAMASGLIADGRIGHRHSTGRERAAHRSRGQAKRVHDVLPPEPGNEPNPEDKQRILQSIRDARQHADLVIVYEHNHVFLNRPFTALFLEELPERLAPADWLKKWTHEEIDAGADIIVMHGACRCCTAWRSIATGRSFTIWATSFLTCPRRIFSSTNPSSGKAWWRMCSSRGKICNRSRSSPSR